MLFAIFFRWLGMGLPTTLVALFGIGLIATAWDDGSLATGYLTQDIHLGIVRVGFSFLVWVLICRLRDHIKVPRLHWSVAVPAVGLLLVMPAPEGLRWLYDAACVILLFPGLILAGAQSQPRSARMLAMFGWMGRASYALYAIHAPLASISQFLAENNPEIPYRVWGLPFFFAATGLAFLLDRMFDVPFRRWLTARLLTRPTSPSAVGNTVTQARPP